MPLPDLTGLKDDELVRLYPALLSELRRRSIIRSKNVVGDLSERLAIATYNSTPGLPNLQAAPPGTQNVEAISRNGERYSIKTTTSNTTGVFYGLPPQGSEEVPKQKFEYVIIVRFDDEYQLRGVYEIPWEQLLKHKRWHSRMSAWNLALTVELISVAKCVSAD